MFEFRKKDVLRVWHIWYLSKKNEKNEDGLPLSLWESSAAMVNAYGGIILLGMKELDDETLPILWVYRAWFDMFLLSADKSMPYLTDDNETFDHLMKTAKDINVDYAIFEPLNLRGETKQVYYQMLKEQYPSESSLSSFVRFVFTVQI